MVDSITFRPTEEQGRCIDGLIQAGDYANQSEVIRAGIRLLQEHRAGSQLQALRQTLIEGEESGDGGVLDMEAIRQEARVNPALL